MAGIHDISNSSHHELLPDIEQNLTQLRIAHSKQPKLLLQILRQLRQVEPAKRQERDTDQESTPSLTFSRKGSLRRDPTVIPIGRSTKATLAPMALAASAA